MQTGAGSEQGSALGIQRVAQARPPEDEVAAVHDTLHGNPAAFGLFFERYGQRAYRSAVFLLGPARGDAEDVVQETFVDALHGLRSYRPTRPFYPWLYTILRRRVARHRRMRSDMDLDAAPPVPDSTEDADLYWALSHITLERREVLLLHHVLGYGVQEIAAMLGVPAGTVKSRLARAREAMARLLREANPHAGRD